MKNEVKNENDKKSRIKNIWKIIKKLPSAIKIVLVILIIALIFYIGGIWKSVITNQTKTTKLGLENVGELVTQTAYLTIVQDTEEHREFFDLFEIPFTQSRQIFSYDIQVDASVDFSKITYEIDGNKDNQKIKVKLPHAKIYKSSIDNESLKIYLDEESLFSRIDLAEHNEAMKQLTEQGIKDAEANGLLKAGDENAKKLIETFFKSNGYEDYQIEYEYI